MLSTSFCSSYCYCCCFKLAPMPIATNWRIHFDFLVFFFFSPLWFSPTLLRCVCSFSVCRKAHFDLFALIRSWRTAERNVAFFFFPFLATTTPFTRSMPFVKWWRWWHCQTAAAVVLQLYHCALGVHPLSPQKWQH